MPSEERNDDGRPYEVRDMIHELELSLFVGQELNGNDRPTRCRELSLAITKIEEALHWLHAITERR